MKHKSRIKIALVGNPNSGKSSIFNLLTGLRQKISNFPGVTVDKKTANLQFSGGQEYAVIDLPGTYSVFPNSPEEKIVVNILTDKTNLDYPDLVVYVADVTQLDRHLLLATQITDLGFPMIFVLNMIDIAGETGLNVDLECIQKFLKVPVIPFSGRTKFNLDLLKNEIEKFSSADQTEYTRPENFCEPSALQSPLISQISKEFDIENPFLVKLLTHHYQWLSHLTAAQRQKIQEISTMHSFRDLPLQVEDTMHRFSLIEPVVRNAIRKDLSGKINLTQRIDRIVTDRIIGPAIFFVIMFLVFQAIFSWATYPMDWIEYGFAQMGQWLSDFLPESWFTDLLVNGVLAGLSGVIIFVPQITILFLLISLLEESGYMSRAVFMFDHIMQKFGMNGRSIVSLISSGACAIPAIMATRTISNPKERLITILVSPFISCSARIPVYAILIGFVVPSVTVLGIFNAQGLVFMGLYLLGIIAVLVTSYFFKKVLPQHNPSFLMIELPDYKSPIWNNVLLNVREKVMSFIREAGKVIVVISIALWFLASYGPPDRMNTAGELAAKESVSMGLTDSEAADLLASYKIESSYAGIMGKFIEPAIKPLGFDWKIGIALITSFAAREVFVGTMATIYSVGSADDEATLRQRMAAELKPDRKSLMFDFPTSLSLLLFYVFALQCMSTLAVVRKETGSWKWPVLQFLFMGALAYLSSFLAYQIFS
ncbi:MAG: ferrous iron transport protein B [Saprospiraceae bacterium]|nr:ferrous iron transport protein B [Saprospiraceae bacterium]